MTARRVALVTGGSRGVGAATCRALAREGFDVILTCRNKLARAASVAAEVERLGGRALAVQSDITSGPDRARLAGAVGAWGRGLDALVLNASGGLEKELLAADAGYPVRVNRDAQVEMVEAAWQLLNPGAVVVHVTSHWAHLHGRVEQFPDYEPVAASKHAGEMALRALKPRLAERGASLAVVTGDLVEGTITARLLERRTSGLTARRRDESGRLPTVEDMAEAIAAVCTDGGALETVVVGGSLSELLSRGSAVG
ncbi:MAG: SDR family oxidoreductase [Candidatus Dormibacteria bacterium]